MQRPYILYIYILNGSPLMERCIAIFAYFNGGAPLILHDVRTKNSDQSLSLYTGAPETGFEHFSCVKAGFTFHNEIEIMSEVTGNGDGVFTF